MSILKNRNEVITYTIDKNVNTDVYISVQNGEVVVNVPWYFSRNQIQEVVEDKKRWIIDKIKEYELRRNAVVNMGNIRIYGKDFIIQIYYKNIRKSLR